MKKIKIIAAVLCLGVASLEAVVNEHGAPEREKNESQVEFTKRLLKYNTGNGKTEDNIKEL
ncbi:MAG: hypothetical protein LBD81_02585 [Holosporaceae bacterium]|nr:hypothetical protein [Holosporaceae bacterium]